jgi:hypothetical protein
MFSICVKFWKSQFDMFNLHFWIYISYLPWVICFFNVCSLICFLWFVCPKFLCVRMSIYVKFSISFEFKLVLSFVVSKLFICETFSLWWQLHDIHLNSKFGLFFLSFVVFETPLTNTHPCFDLPTNNSFESLCEIVYTYLSSMENR